MVAEIREQHESEWAAISAVTRLLGVGSAEKVRKWVRQAQVDAATRQETTTEESADLKRLRRENAELRRTNVRYLEDSVGFLRGRARQLTLVAVFPCLRPSLDSLPKHWGTAVSSLLPSGSGHC
jgi:transposase-like protein